MMYFQTNDETRVIEIGASNDVAGVVDADQVFHGGFNLANTCTTKTMCKVKNAAIAEGLRVVNPTVMAVR